MNTVPKHDPWDWHMYTLGWLVEKGSGWGGSPTSLMGAFGTQRPSTGHVSWSTESHERDDPDSWEAGTRRW